MSSSFTTYTSGNACVQLSHYAESGIGECHAIITPQPALNLAFEQQVSAVVSAFAQVLSAHPRLKPVFKRYFLSDAANQAHMLPSNEPCAVSVVEQPPLSGVKVALWAYMAEDVDVQPAGEGFYAVTHAPYIHLWRGGMAAPDLTSETATVAMLGDYAMQLESMGMTLANNCLRTWFFVHDVDINYRGMVNGRNEVFRYQGLTAQTHFIASTGIGGKHPDPTVMVEMDAYAVKGLLPAQVRYLQALTHLNPTYEYGVAFERATAIEYGDRTHVLVSGTASIDNKGEVVHVGDIEGQTGRMCSNVQALLAEAGCEWQHVRMAIVYLRDMADYRTVREALSRRGLTHFPAVYVLAPVCRHAWLVEMECIAIKPATAPYPPF